MIAIRKILEEDILEGGEKEIKLEESESKTSQDDTIKKKEGNKIIQRLNEHEKKLQKDLFLSKDSKGSEEKGNVDLTNSAKNRTKR